VNTTEAIAPHKRERRKQDRPGELLEAALDLFVEKGFAATRVEEVALRAGVSKGTLFLYFPSKEDLAAAAMVRVLIKAQAFLDTLDPSAEPLLQLKAVVRWMMALQLAGEMPSLPSQNSSLRAKLMANTEYLGLLMAVSERIGAWIEAAQHSASLSPTLPPILVLYTLYSRACDPVLEFMKAGGQYSDEAIVEWVVTTCFDGLRSR
jgi:AcrR family transcriptional regulator